jgi:hypothetical protein
VSRSLYDARFFESQSDGSLESAREVVPLILDLVSPTSVIDVGCGMGTWLRVFKEHGVENILGIDGPYVDTGSLQIPGDRFLAADLSSPFDSGLQADLAVSLEVAEHIPREHVDTYVRSLSRLAPCLVFSAAIPGQGGTAHVNEQWPDYWVQKFSSEGFMVIDAIRREIWSNERVKYWYAQNILVFATSRVLETHPRLAVAADATNPSQLSVVHPKCLENVDAKRNYYLALYEALCAIPSNALPIFVNEGGWDPWLHSGGREALRFLERDAECWGPPADDATAVEELQRSIAGGATHIVFLWTAFWWLDHYTKFTRYLRTNHICIRDDSRSVIFDVRGAHRPAIESAVQ